MPSNSARDRLSRSRGASSASTGLSTNSGLDCDMKRTLARRQGRREPPGGKVFVGFRLYHPRDALDHRPLRKLPPAAGITAFLGTMHRAARGMVERTSEVFASRRLRKALQRPNLLATAKNKLRWNRPPPLP